MKYFRPLTVRVEDVVDVYDKAEKGLCSHK